MLRRRVVAVLCVGALVLLVVLYKRGPSNWHRPLGLLWLVVLILIDLAFLFGGAAVLLNLRGRAERMRYSRIWGERPTPPSLRASRAFGAVYLSMGLGFAGVLLELLKATRQVGTAMTFIFGPIFVGAIVTQRLMDR